MVGDPYFFLNGPLLLIDIYVLWENKKNLSSGSLIFCHIDVLNSTFSAFLFAVQQFKIRFIRVKFNKKDGKTKNY